MTDRSLQRHSLRDRVVHWCNAVLWIFLALSGFALLDNPALTLFGGWFSRLCEALFGGKAALLQAHIAAGLIWTAFIIASVVFNAASARVFLRELFCLNPGDWQWLWRKPLIMLLGKKICARLGLPVELPEQGFYNIGQKGFGVASLFGSLVLGLTGFVLALAAYNVVNPGASLMALCIVLHYLCAGLTFAGLLVHVYMAAIAPDERPGLRSMFTGEVPVHYARSHHGLWVKSMERSQERIQA